MYARQLNKLILLNLNIMIFWVIRVIIISVIFIFLIHHIFFFFRDTMTTRRIKDLIHIKNKNDDINKIINTPSQNEEMIDLQTAINTASNTSNNTTNINLLPHTNNFMQNPLSPNPPQSLIHSISTTQTAIKNTDEPKDIKNELLEFIKTQNF
jgi:hypothetical protein